MRALSASLIGLFAAGCSATAGPSMQSFSGSETTSLVLASNAAPEAQEDAVAPATLTDRLLTLCGPENGFALGAAGAKDDGLCTGENAAAFASAYAEGAALFAARVEVQQVKAEISAAQRELWTIKRKRTVFSANVATLSGRPDDRRTEKADRELLAAEEARLIAAIDALQKALAGVESEVRRREAAGFSAPATDVAIDSGAPVAVTPASY